MESCLIGTHTTSSYIYVQTLMYNVQFNTEKWYLKCWTDSVQSTATTRNITRHSTDNDVCTVKTLWRHLCKQNNPLLKMLFTFISYNIIDELFIVYSTRYINLWKFRYLWSNVCKIWSIIYQCWIDSYLLLKIWWLTPIVNWYLV